MHELELKLRAHGHGGAEIARMGSEEVQCRLLHIAHGEAQDELEA